MPPNDEFLRRLRALTDFPGIEYVYCGERDGSGFPDKVLNRVLGHQTGVRKGSKKGLGRRVPESANGAARAGKNSAGARLDPQAIHLLRGVP